MRDNLEKRIVYEIPACILGGSAGVCKMIPLAGFQDLAKSLKERHREKKGFFIGYTLGVSSVLFTYATMPYLVLKK